MTGDGSRFLDHLPERLIYKKRENVMQIQVRDPEEPTKGGSILQIVGAKEYDSLIGTNPIGLVFSEYAVQNPMAWELGMNHCKNLWDEANKYPDEWFSQLLTIKDTKRPDGSPVVSESDIEREREKGKDEDFLNQEYYCGIDGRGS
jgi:hypothetical protein